MSKIEDKLNGRLGDRFNLSLDTKLSQEEYYRSLYIIFKLDRINKLLDDPEVTLTNKQCKIIIKVNNTTVYAENIDIDTRLGDNIFYKVKDIKLSDKKTILNISASLIIDDESNYINTTELKEDIVIPENKIERLFVKINKISEDSNNITVGIQYNIDPDYLQYKSDENPWKKLDDIAAFTIEKTHKNQYIQVRGRKDDYYSYSNVIRLFRELKL